MRVELRKAGYGTVERVLDFDKLTDLEPRMTPLVDVKLTATPATAPGDGRSNRAAPR
jgi:hypothetical protein